MGSRFHFRIKIVSQKFLRDAEVTKTALTLKQQTNETQLVDVTDKIIWVFCVNCQYSLDNRPYLQT